MNSKVLVVVIGLTLLTAIPDIMYLRLDPIGTLAFILGRFVGLNALAWVILKLASHL